jgi:glutaminyl-peptide cyclotransferase
MICSNRPASNRLPASGFRLPVCGFRLPASGFRLPSITCGFRLQAEVSRAALILMAIITGFTAPGSAQRAETAAVSRYEVVRAYPHDPKAFTQGLQFVDGFLYEGTGMNGASSIRKVRLETGEVLQVKTLEDRYFGEGITIFGDSLIQLTWKAGVGFVYDVKTFERRGTFNYAGEGWGLTHDGTRLIMSDGSSALRFLDPRTFKETGRLPVTDGGRPVPQLNELEVVNGEIYANVWQTERIARISPTTGQVIGWIDLRGLLNPAEAARVDVLNGIAYDAAKDRLFVTGKWWPKLFEVRIR